MTGRILLSFFIIIFTAVYGYAHEYRLGDHELLLMPTAYTMPEGNSYFSDSDFLFITYGAAVSSRTHLGAFAIFPFVETITLGVKQNYFRSEFAEVSCWMTFTPGIRVLSIGNVASIGDKSTSLHLGICAVSEIDRVKTDFHFFKGREKENLLHMIGFMTSLMNETSIIAEYANYGSVFDYEKSGLLSLGFRIRNIRNTTMSLDIGGILPLRQDEKFDLYPLVKANVFFR